ncbi:ribosomal RNA small subunit methyltransferase G [Vallitalea longa]|uniref:Ribosomal RNA small subunit methyltransferase G n=1 Tax=Vallitalea longa TaxID=2936439 RepID=A0A9W5YCY4_9FIRM|nr:16S rRNA (guanine(527)-N(7))-methyltransferase RsmG [Vallitalea longa]GKX30311.1 ribosomal RNA small subunit methyltransferase G [Vallitalea longa]
MIYNHLLIEGAEKLGYKLTDIQVKQFNKYYEMLIKWNKKINLTSIIDEQEVILKHFLDSIAIKEVIDLNICNSLIDLGTGAGFPGIPLKIVFPNLKVTLVDSLNKRINFLLEVIDELSLEDIQCIHSRAEDLGNTDLYREQFDLCVSRAVADLSILSEYCIPFVRHGGYFISYKSNKSQEEIYSSKGAMEKLGACLEKIKNVEVPFLDIERTFVVIKKVKNTPNKYPRKAGKPKKSPLR